MESRSRSNKRRAAGRVAGSAKPRKKPAVAPVEWHFENIEALIDSGEGGAPIDQPTPIFPRLELPEDEEAAA